eukprot:m.17111 g.17111  ORF g.17111 m.17111 type:complete len:829 (+) comp10650_c0_seq1:73-2559(+)
MQCQGFGPVARCYASCEFAVIMTQTSFECGPSWTSGLVLIAFLSFSVASAASSMPSASLFVWPNDTAVPVRLRNIRMTNKLIAIKSSQSWDLFELASQRWQRRTLSLDRYSILRVLEVYPTNDSLVTFMAAAERSVTVYRDNTSWPVNASTGIAGISPTTASWSWQASNGDIAILSDPAWVVNSTHLIVSFSTTREEPAKFYWLPTPSSSSTTSLVVGINQVEMGVLEKKTQTLCFVPLVDGYPSGSCVPAYYSMPNLEKIVLLEAGRVLVNSTHVAVYSTTTSRSATVVQPEALQGTLLFTSVHRLAILKIAQLSMTSKTMFTQALCLWDIRTRLCEVTLYYVALNRSQLQEQIDPNTLAISDDALMLVAPNGAPLMYDATAIKCLVILPTAVLAGNSIVQCAEAKVTLAQGEIPNLGRTTFTSTSHIITRPLPSTHPSTSLISPSTVFVPSPSNKSHDSSTIWLLASLLAGSVVIVILVLYRRKRSARTFASFVELSDDLYKMELEEAPAHRSSTPQDFKGQDMDFLATGRDSSLSLETLMLGSNEVGFVEQVTIMHGVHAWNPTWLQSALTRSLHGREIVSFVLEAAMSKPPSLEVAHECISLLLRAGANLEYCDPETGCTPLMAAAKHGNALVFTTLLAMGADASGVDNQGRGILALACLSASPSMLQSLGGMAHFLHSERLDSTGKAALHWLLGVGCPTLLVLYASDLELPLSVVDVEGNTLWHYVVKENRADLIPILLSLNRSEASLLIMELNDAGQSPLQLAQALQADDMVTTLQPIVESLREGNETDKRLRHRFSTCASCSQRSSSTNRDCPCFGGLCGC